MYIATTIPENVLDRVRNGARSALLEPIAKLSALAEHHPQLACPPYTDELLTQVKRSVSLLYAIGWSTGEVIAETTLDINEYGPSLCEALSEAMRIATVEVKNTEPCERRQVRRACCLSRPSLQLLRLRALSAPVATQTFTCSRRTYKCS